MTYNIFSGTAPAMPKPSKGTEFIKFALSQASKDMREVLIPMAMPALAAHLTEVKFMYSDNKYYEMCGQMGHLIGPSGIGKAQLRPPRGSQPPHVVDPPLPPPAHSPTVRWLPQDRQVVHPVRSTPHYRTPGRAPGEVKKKKSPNVPKSPQMCPNVQTAKTSCRNFASEIKKESQPAASRTIPNISRTRKQTIKNQSTMKDSKKETLKTVLQFIVSVITALLASLGVHSCITL